MRSTASFITVLLIYLAIEIYLYFGVKSFLNSNEKKAVKSFKFIYLTVTLGGVLALLLMVVLRGTVTGFWMNMTVGVFMINLIVKLVLLPFILVDDVRRLGLFTRKKIVKHENPITRSSFLQKAGLLTASIPLAALTTGVVIGGAYRYKLHQKTLGFKNIPKAFHGLKILQLSDIHVGSFYDKDAVQKGIQLAMDQKPDVVFFTGDLVNDNAREMDNYYDVFSQIKAPMGVFSILGNHDYGDYHQWESEEAKIANFEAVKAIHAKLGWQLLLDEHVYLEKEGGKIAVIGVENWGSGFHKIGNLSKAYQNCQADFKMLLSHDPTHWEEEVTKNYLDIDLTFSGHTHGAQMGIETHGFKWSPIQFRYSRWAGLYQKNNQHLYINRGFGFLGYPGRIGIWPEISVIELQHQA